MGTFVFETHPFARPRRKDVPFFQEKKVVAAAGPSTILQPSLDKDKKDKEQPPAAT